MTNDERMTKPEYRSHGPHPFWSLSHLSILSSLVIPPGSACEAWQNMPRYNDA
jgi:hypothetical protein